LETLGFLAGMVIENERLQQSHAESERLQRDIEIASRIQQTLLLGQPPVDLIIGDVMGKGIPAALVGAATKNHFLRAMNQLMAARRGKLPEATEILTI